MSHNRRCVYCSSVGCVKRQRLLCLLGHELRHFYCRCSATHFVHTALLLGTLALRLAVLSPFFSAVFFKFLVGLCRTLEHSMNLCSSKLIFLHFSTIKLLHAACMEVACNCHIGKCRGQISNLPANGNPVTCFDFVFVFFSFCQNVS